MNVQKGDLAIVMKAVFPCNLGKVVEIHSFYGGDDNCWYISNGKKIKTGLGDRFLALCPDKNLKKISGPEALDGKETEAFLAREKILTEKKKILAESLKKYLQRF